MNEKNMPLLDPLLTDQSSLAKEYRIRNPEFQTKSVSPKRVDSYYEEGWEYDRKLKKKIRIKKKRPHDERLENLFWCLLYKMGYQEMNKGRHFKIKYEMSGVGQGDQQIDVFGKDDETVVITECKSAKDLKPKNLKKRHSSICRHKRSVGEIYKEALWWWIQTKNPMVIRN